MKKLNLKKEYIIAVVALVSIISLFTIISNSKADDDEGDGENRQPRVVQPVVQPIVQPQPIQIVQPQQVVEPEPVVQPDRVVIPQPTVAPVTAPKQVNTVIRQNTVVTIPDNSAVLAALKDSDNDGVPDIVDKHPGEDDFAYTMIDNNHNGIADNLEALIK